MRTFSIYIILRVRTKETHASQLVKLNKWCGTFHLGNVSEEKNIRNDSYNGIDCIFEWVNSQFVGQGKLCPKIKEKVPGKTYQIV